MFKNLLVRKILITKLFILVLMVSGTAFVYAANPYDSTDQSADLQMSAQNNTMLDVLDLKNMEIADVLKLISQKSGLNIAASQNVKGRVTIYLKEIKVLEALEIIVDSYNWAFAQDGKVLKVMTAVEYETKYGEKFGQQTKTSLIKLKYANAADIVAVLNQVKGVTGKVISDDKTNILILYDTPAKVIEMQEIVKEIDLPRATEIFDLSYADAETLSGKITEILTPSVGTMRFDDRSNKVIVSDTSRKLEEVRNLVEAFDQRDKEVLIEAKILQVTLNDAHKLGIDWEGIVRNSHDLTFSSNFDILTSTEKSGRVSVGALDTDDYTFLLEALDTIGVTNILSSPSITTLNNQEAKILVGSTEPYVTSTTTTPSSGPTTTAETVNFIDVGVKLFVTPTIHKDNFITMKIKPEVSSVTSNLTTSNNNTIPVVETSEAETSVMVKDRVTIFIGGLIKEDTISTTRKVPFLGDIPFLGHAFKSESDDITKTEIVIFLTPKIITGDVHTDVELKALSDFGTKRQDSKMKNISKSTIDTKTVSQLDELSKASFDSDKVKEQMIEESLEPYLTEEFLSEPPVYLKNNSDLQEK